LYPKLIDDQLFFWEYDPYVSGIKGWTRANSSGALLVNLEYSSFDATSSSGILAHVKTLERTGDQRPSDTPLPPPERIFFIAVYGAERMDIPVLVTYTLNPGYHPTSVEQFETFCSKHTPLSALLPVAFGLGVIALVAWLLLQGRQWRRGLQPPRRDD
jgi:hypothetical protein